MKKSKQNSYKRNNLSITTKLTLKYETIAILSDAQLYRVVGGASADPACTSSDDIDCTRTK